MLRNPPLAAPLPGGGFVVLDGANRTSALRALGARAVPLQVVNYADAAVRLEVWRHFLIIDATDLLGRLGEAGLEARPASEGEAERILAAGRAACALVANAGTFVVEIPDGTTLAGTLAHIVGAYKGVARIYRVQDGDRAALVREYGTEGVLVSFPRFRKSDILAIARAPVKLPTGITRHIISGRALRLNLPLDPLNAPGAIDEKNRWLAEVIRQKLLENRIRYYPEATFLFDE